jgi:bifunctional DNase/RNase
MTGPSSLNLDVLFSRAGTGYQAQITRSPAGDGQSVRFAPPFTDLELENFLLKMSVFRARTRRVESPPVVAAKEMGGRLFDAVFTGPVQECLRRSIDQAEREQAALRIRLRLADCPELSDLPWEFLYDSREDWFPALSERTPVVRYVQLPTQPRAIDVTLPLRILVIRSEPTDCQPLDLESEWAQTGAALRELTNAGLLTITELAASTLGELRRALLQDTYHVLHYMGHGAFDERRGGALLFTDKAGRSVPVTSGDLGVMLRDHTSMRLAVLNACEAGRTDPADPFAGIADTLVRRGIPAVVAMQFAVSDNAAIEFAPALYGALVTGRPIDASVAEARKAIYTVSPLEWATPVLYLRADDARLFDFGQQPPSPASAQASASRPVRMDLIGVRIHEPSNSPLVLLEEQNDGGRYLPVWMEAAEATPIAYAQQKTGQGRPFTHEFFCDVLRAAGLRVTDSTITGLQDGLLSADLALSNGAAIKARPSDAIALAIMTDAPLLATSSVLDRAAIADPGALAGPPEGLARSYQVPPGSVPFPAPGEASAFLLRTYTQADVVGVRVEVPTNNPLVLLRQQKGDRYLPIWIGATEGVAINLALQGALLPRPLTNELLCNVLATAGMRLETVRIASVRDGVFSADVFFSNGRTLTARPSDAITLAIRMSAPILIATTVLDEAGVAIPDQ